MNRFRDALRVLFTPSVWHQQCRYDARWDRKLNQLMAEYRFERDGGYHARLGPVRLWVANHPYASMHPEDIKVRATRATILRAGDKLYAETDRDEVGHFLATLEAGDVLRVMDWREARNA